MSNSFEKKDKNEDVVRPESFNIKFESYLILQLNVETTLRGIILLEKEDRQVVFDTI